MHLITGLDAARPSGAESGLILLLGNFDGVHAGHRQLLNWGVAEAKRTGGVATVFTFDRHPQTVLHPDSELALLTSPEQKLYLLSQCGINWCYWVPFTEAFSRLPAEKFIEDILVKRLKVSQVGLGYDARFGYRRQGDSELMKKLAAPSGFRVWTAEPLRKAGVPVSSSRIRQLLGEGKLETAHECLGRRFGFFGPVVRGRGRGAGLGVPTANLHLPGQALPPEGVYPVKARIMGIHRTFQKPGWETVEIKSQSPWHAGVMNCGKRPTFEIGSARVTEVHLLDFEGDLYGSHLEIEVYPRIREEKAFANAALLKRQIEEDVHQARLCLQKEGSPSK